MELKAVLNKPYTPEQYADFVVANNHELGYEIRFPEEDDRIEAWGYTEDEMRMFEYLNLIEVYRNHLIETDYQAIKYAEGETSEEDYADMKAQRRFWRQEINRLEELTKDFQYK